MSRRAAKWLRAWTSVESSQGQTTSLQKRHISSSLLDHRQFRAPAAAGGRVRLLFTDAEAQKHPPAPVVRPSITWGVIGDKESQKEGRDKVLDFLRAEGINTDEFDSVELPTSVDVMAERLEFVKNLGLEKNHINEYPLIVCCSVKKNMVPVINYLEALGLGSSDLTKLLRRYPMVLHSSVTIDIQPVIIYLMGLGISRNNVPRVLVRYPEMLGFRLEGTMSTSIAFLVSIGVHIKAIAGILVRIPEILGMRVGNNIKPKVDYICSLGMPREAVGKILEYNMHLLKCDLEEVKARVDCLIKAGVSADGMPGLILQYPSVLFSHIEKKIIRQGEWMEKELKVSRGDFARVLERMPQVLNLNQKFAMSRIRFFIARGFKITDIGKMTVSCPQILVRDLRNVKENLEFFEKQMRREKQELIDFPAYFTYGLEERIRFRYKRVAEKDLKFSLAWFLNCSNAVFQQRIAGPIYQEEGKSEKEFHFGGAIEQLRQPDDPIPQIEDYDFEDDEEPAMGIP